MNDNTQPQKIFDDYVFYAEKTDDEGLMRIPPNAFTQWPGKPGEPGTRSIQQQENYLCPSNRYDTVIVYDTSRNKIVLFGGYTSFFGSNFYNDTWEWDGQKWNQVVTLFSPPANATSYSPCAAYDEARYETVLFIAPGETWVYNGSNWIQKSPATNPSARYNAAMAYDPIREKIVMFGGYDGISTNYNDTWEWDGTDWTQIIPATTTPSARSGAVMAYDGTGVLMFAGLTNETWRWDGTDWTQLSPANSPGLRTLCAMCTYKNDNLLLFGGDNGASLFNDTWQWDGTDWTQLTTSVINPIARRSISMAYDVSNNQVVLFGGYIGVNDVGDTWKWVDDKWLQTNVYVEKHFVVNLPFTFNFCGVDYKQIAVSGDGDAILIDPNLEEKYEEGDLFHAVEKVYKRRSGEISYDSTNSNLMETFELNKKHVVLMPWCDQHTTSYNNYDQFLMTAVENGDPYSAINSNEVTNLKQGIVSEDYLQEYKIDESDYAVRYCKVNTSEGQAFVVRWNVISGLTFTS